VDFELEVDISVDLPGWDVDIVGIQEHVYCWVLPREVVWQQVKPVGRYLVEGRMD
jgi:hypothetical protein